MIYATPITDEGILRNRENAVNEQDRHCRIGRVRKKSPALWSEKSEWWKHIPGVVFPEVFTFPQMTPTQMTPMCGCKPGTICGNVACPHLSISTCSA